MNVFTQKVCLKKQEKIIVKIKEKEDLVSESLVGLRHPFLAEIYGVKKQKGYTLVAEELVRGISLDGILRGKGLPLGWENEFNVKEIAGIGIQLCEAVEALHNQTPPILHCDIKPENILLTSRAPIRIKLIDCDDGVFFSPNTIYAHSYGTPGFAAPEQHTAQPLTFGTDIYGIGRTLEFLLYGACFTHTSRCRKLQGIIHRACNKKQENRYLTVMELMNELEKCR